MHPTSVIGEELTGASMRIGREEPVGSASDETGLGRDLEKLSPLRGVDPRLGIATETAVRPAPEAKAVELVKIDLHAGVGGRHPDPGT